MDSQTKYTQVIDEKTGEIKYVPEAPPTPPQANPGGEDEGSGENEKDMEPLNTVYKAMNLPKVDSLVAVLRGLEENNKKLRYAKRLQTGKLDGSRLTAYKTSDKLFKRKAIKHKDYQFTLLVDTSGSMFGADDEKHYDTDKEIFENSKLKVSLESVVQTVRALEELKIPVSVFAMNGETRLIKPFDEDFDLETLLKRFTKNIMGTYNGDENMGGTAEGTAYREASAYIARNTHSPKKENIVFVISDGAPGWGAGTIPVYLEDEKLKEVPNERDENRVDALKAYWERSPYKAYGIGIMSDAKQIPRSKRLNEIEKLPDFMADLIQEIML